MNKNMIIGSLLGDGYLEKGERSRNARFKLKQRYQNIDYIKYMSLNLGDLSSGKILIEKSKKPSKLNGKICHLEECWNGEYCKSAIIWSYASKIFTEYHDEWYVEKTKIVPRTLMINPEILAHWFVEDGCNQINVDNKSKCVELSTHSFTLEECDFLKCQLENMGFKSKVYNGPMIRIMAESYFDFMDLVRPFVLKFGSFDYKVDVSLAPKDRVGKKWRGPRFNINIAREIRLLRSTNKYNLSDLAKMFDTTISTIGKIVNYQMYKEIQSPLVISGQAGVNHGY